jgi:hypothetical protein
MVVVTGDFHHVENQIKVSFNSKFTLIHGKEYFQGNEDEIKLEFLKIVYNHQMTNSKKMTVDTIVVDTVVESKAILQSGPNSGYCCSNKIAKGNKKYCGMHSEK